MVSFLAEDNLCGTTLLRLVARGNSIITELFRLARNLPPYLSHLADGQQGVVLDPDQAKYRQVLFGFSYLKDPDEFERRVNQSTELTDIDTEFQENNQGLLERFYQLFESILKYQQDLKQFVDDVGNGFYIQHTLSTILLDTAGKQLMCEAVYLFGIMLLMMETYLPGPTREKIVVAHYRKSGQANIDNFDDIVRLCRSTGYVPVVSKARPKNYPENFFARFQLPRELIQLCIGRLQSDDVYLASTAFPNPDQRSTALANQGAMLYVLLYFSPKTLSEETGSMREIVDKHFNDNWIIALYMGHVVDLSVEWAGYKAAKAALDNVLQPSYVSTLNARNVKLVSECVEETRQFLVEGVMTEQFVTDNVNPLIDCMRRCNVALRWRMLHRRTTNKKFHDVIVGNGTSPDVIITLLLQTAQLEWRLKSVFESLLQAKDKTCEECKAQSVARLTELSEFFSGEKALTRGVEKNENLMKWFANTAAEVKALDYDEDHATVTGRKIKEFIRALQDVQQFETLDTNLQIQAYLQETCDFLFQIVRTVNLKQTDLQIMDTVSDTSYAWHVIADYVDNIHARVISEPSTVVLLRATLLKLASMLEVPLIRINQCESPDTISVAEYYSSELVEFLRRVLEIIPKSVFKNLLEIVDIQTNRMRPMPIKLEAVNLKDYAQLDERHLMAKLTHRVSVFTEGILAMEKTLLGVIQVDPRKILEEGLRKELVRKVSEAMHEILVFNSSSSATSPGGEVERVMTRLAVRMAAFQRSTEYVQDYIDMAGLKLWQQELSRVIYYNIEQECNRFLKKKVYDHQSSYQSRAIPIPRFPPLAGEEATTFMGRVLSAVLRVTDPRSTVFSPECSGWYQAGDGSEVCGLGTFSVMTRAIGVIGLGGLDRLLAFHIVHQLGLFLRFYRASVVREHAPFLEQLHDRLFPPWASPDVAPKLYATAKTTLEKLMSPALQSILLVGQAQLLRRQIAKELLFVCRMDANLYHQALDTLNRSLLSDIRQHYRQPESCPYPSEQSPLLPELTLLLEKSGLDDPLQRIYVTTDPVEGLPAFLLVFTISYLPKLEYDANFGTLVRKKPAYPLDGAALIAGLVTVLRQFHPIYTAHYLRLLGQFMRVSMDAVYRAAAPQQRYSGGGGADGELPSEVVAMAVFLRDLTRSLQVPKDVVATLVPPHLVQTAK